MTANEAAAVWWAERFLIQAKAQKFHDALLAILNRLRTEWTLSVGTTEGPLRMAIEEAFLGLTVPPTAAVFPDHLVMEMRDGVLWIKDRQGSPWRVLRW